MSESAVRPLLWAIWVRAIAALVSGFLIPIANGAVWSADRPETPFDFPLAFDSERIRIIVEPDSIQVDGLYSFVRHLEEIEEVEELEEVSLFYPFPRDSLLGGARMISLEGRVPGGRWEPLRFEHPSPQVSGVRWWIPLGAEPRYEVHGTYRQERREDYGRYIVTTTSAWGAPLRRARFELVLPAGSSLLKSSYAFEPGKEGLLVFETTRFQPDRDVTFRWTGTDAR